MLFRQITALIRPSFIVRTMSSDTGKLSGKVAIVTASTAGIGFAIAKRLAQDGAKVVVSSRREGNVEKALAELTDAGFNNILGVQCNVSSEKDRRRLVDETVSKLGGIDILVSNAAVNPTMGGVMDTSEPVWDKIMDVNVKCSLLLSQSVVPHMEKRGGGSILYISSIAGYNPIPLLGAYSVSKTALLGLTKAAACELAAKNIRVNCIAPGIVNTKFSAPMTQNDAFTDMFLPTVPLKRIAEPEEMAGLASFLVSDDASYITGENIVAAGGIVSHL